MQTARQVKQNYQTSLRLPKSMAEQIQAFADQWGLSSSYVYRKAIGEFISSKINQKR